MTLPSFNAEQSLYRSSGHYRSSAVASAVGGIRPSDIPPHGSYTDSCFDCCSNGSELWCYCYDENGNPNLTNLGVWTINACLQCGDISNNNVAELLLSSDYHVGIPPRYN